MRRFVSLLTDYQKKVSNMTDYQKGITDYLTRFTETLARIDKSEINNFINVLETARKEGKQIFTMGNGGSASTASHFVCDFNKGLSWGFDAPRYKFQCLNDSLPTLTAYANDVSYEDAYVEILKNMFESGDVVIGISGSGSSKNVLNAIEYANANGGITVGLTGYSGGRLKQIAKYGVHIPIDDMQIAEDAHMMLDHLAMSVIRDSYKK